MKNKTNKILFQNQMNLINLNNIFIINSQKKLVKFKIKII